MENMETYQYRNLKHFLETGENLPSKARTLPIDESFVRVIRNMSSLTKEEIEEVMELTKASKTTIRRYKEALNRIEVGNAVGEVLVKVAEQEGIEIEDVPLSGENVEEPVEETVETVEFVSTMETLVKETLEEVAEDVKKAETEKLHKLILDRTAERDTAEATVEKLRGKIQELTDKLDATLEELEETKAKATKEVKPLTFMEKLKALFN